MEQDQENLHRAGQGVPYIGSPLNVSYAEFFCFMLQFLCLQMCVHGGSAVPQGVVGDRHLVTVPRGWWGTVFLGVEKDKRGVGTGFQEIAGITIFDVSTLMETPRQQGLSTHFCCFHALWRAWDGGSIPVAPPFSGTLPVLSRGRGLLLSLLDRLHAILLIRRPHGTSQMHAGSR